MSIREYLIANKDSKNADFQAKLTPTLPRENFLGIKVPRVREIEKEYRNTDEAKEFLNNLPHKYFDENMLHAVMISNIKDYDEVISLLEKFLPYVDNWAVCDIMSPVIFKKNKQRVIDDIKKWISSKHSYTVRFGIEMLMSHFLDADFNPCYLELPAKIVSEEYYVNMMIAWFYATALTKQWESAVPYIRNKCLPDWVHNKTISKACDSYRITPEQKEYLKTFRISKR